MALFKVVKYVVNGIMTPFRVNIDGNGLFWCEPGALMAAALSIKRIEASTFKEVDSQIFEATQKYNALHTTHEYVIKYRFHFSPRVKKQMPLSVMDEVNHKKTQGAGNQGFYNDEIGIIIVWFPMVKTKLGDTIRTRKLRVADERDVKYTQDYGELFKGDLHKPYSELLFFAYDSYWDNNDKLYFEIPLNEETFNFFTGVETNLINIITAMFNFLSADANLLLNNIAKAMLTGGHNLLNQ